MLTYITEVVDPMLMEHDKTSRGKGIAAGLADVASKVGSPSAFLFGSEISAADVSLGVSLARAATGPNASTFEATYPDLFNYLQRVFAADCYATVFPAKVVKQVEKKVAAVTGDEAAPTGPRPAVIASAPSTIRVPMMEKSFGGRVRLAALLESSDYDVVGKKIVVAGWTRTIRQAGAGSLLFVELNDGSSAKNLQVVVNSQITGFDKLSVGSISASVRFEGHIVKCKEGAKQAIELHVTDSSRGDNMVVYDVPSVAEYPLAGKDLTVETLRKHAHLRPRSTFISAIMRVRSQMAMATHRFFQDRGFNYIHTPLITASDCEGAGEMFQVTTVLPHTDDLSEVALLGNKKIDYSKDFFGKKAFLTVSGQLALENYACALSDVYTFGPTFRAEMSHTTRHLAEFWMIEPEMAFATLEDVMGTAEGYLKFCVRWALENCSADIEYLATRATEPNLLPRLQQIASEKLFNKVTYTDAIKILKPHAERFEDKNIEFGLDLASEHERFLTEEIFKGPTFVYNYPKSFKAFYMRRNDDNETVQACDLLLPQIGEVIGGSAREERLDQLDAALTEKGLNIQDYWWYRDLRTYGTIPHGGFGLGFERLTMLVTGVANIRDVIPYPRYPGHADF